MPDKSWALHRKLLRAPSIGFNAEVYNWFKDADETKSRKALRDSLLIQSKESRTSAMFKIQYFRESIQKVHQKTAVVGVPKDDFDESVQYRVHINLYFQQEGSAVPSGESPVDATSVISSIRND